MAKYQKYTEYKDSGVEWLGEIPSHWDFSCLKYLLDKMVAGGTPESTNDAYWAESGDGIPWVSIADITKNFEITATKKDVTELGLSVKNLQILPKNTILYSIFASLGKVSSAQVPLVTNQAILGLIPKVSKLDNRYLVRWLQAIESNLAIFSTSNTQDNLNAEKVGNLPLFNPPLNEQRSIANFLDHETTQIDTLIAKQEKLIELLKEKRQAVISHAVTKGLNPNVSMKDSGVEWLGQVPEHWTVKPNKYLLDFVTSGSRGWAQYYADTGSLFFRIANLTRDTIEPKLESLQFVEPPQGSEGERSKIKVGDLLISITADLGSVCVADTSIGNGYVSQHIALCRPQKLYDSRWLAYYILSDTAKEQLLGSGYGGTKIQLSLEDIKELVVVVPSQEEQREIANYIDDKLNQFEHLINQAYKFVGTLRERRITLISSAVTGKIDVRNWQHPNEAKTGLSS